MGVRSLGSRNFGGASLFLGSLVLLLSGAWFPAPAPRLPGTESAVRLPPAPGAEPTSQEVEVRLNGRPLGRGLLLGTGDPGEVVYLRVADLALAVDGPPPAAKRHLRLQGSSLFANTLGGCAGCSVRVNRIVLVSSRVRRFKAQAYLPLGDVVRAFEGRLEAEDAGRVYGIYAGACCWCILEPTGR